MGGAFNTDAFNNDAFYVDVEATPRTYPLAGMSQSFPGDTNQTYPLAGQTQDYPMVAA